MLASLDGLISYAAKVHFKEKVSAMKDIPGYEGKYSITRDGRVWSHPRVDAKGATRKGKWLKSASGAAVAMDASPAVFMRDAMRKLARRWTKRFDDIAHKLSDRFATNAMINTDVSLGNALKDAGFTVEFKMTSQMNNALQATISENVGLIRSISEKYFTEVEGMVMRSVARGRDLGYLTEELQKRYGITRRRATLIARDQNAKATSVM